MMRCIPASSQRHANTYGSLPSFIIHKISFFLLQQQQQQRQRWQHYFSRSSLGSPHDNLNAAGLFRNLPAIRSSRRWISSSSNKQEDKEDGGVRTQDNDDQRAFFDALAQQMNLKHLDEWYQIPTYEVLLRGGSSILERHGNSLKHALQAAYPEHQWDPKRFRQVPHGYWADVMNQRRFLDHLAQVSGVKQPDDWCKLTLEEVRARGGAGLLARYNNSLIRALQAVYPEHQWQPMKLRRGYWADKNNQREFLERIAPELNVKQLDDWHNVSVQAVVSRGGGTLIQYHYGGSLMKALQAIYPEHPWKRPNKETDNPTKVPFGHWKDTSNHRRFFDSLARQFDIKQFEDWYEISTDDVSSQGGRALLAQYYGGSLVRALQSIYPEHPWDVSRFSSIPRRYWADINNQRKFFDRLADELGIKNLDDWNNVTVEDVRSRGGAGLLKGCYNNSLIRALQAVYPDHPWQLPKRNRKFPFNYWADVSNQRQFFDEIASVLNIKQLDDWYGIKTDQVRAHGGSGVLKRYNSSLSRALRTVYPEHAWIPWKFNRATTKSAQLRLDSNTATTTTTTATTTTTTTTITTTTTGTPVAAAGAGAADGGGAGLDDINQLKDYIEALAKEFNVVHLDDWYRVSIDQIRQFGGLAYIQHHGGLYLVLSRVFPHHNWDEEKFAVARSRIKSSQRWLSLILRKMFPQAEILEDYIHTQLLFQSSQQPMELDIYIPELGIAFEYHGAQHYKEIHFFGSTSKYSSHDSEKTAACRSAGITLIDVPYWWDRTQESLAAMIHAARPDLADLLAAGGGDGGGRQGARDRSGKNGIESESEIAL